jgi:hypothetical protein
MVRIKMKLSANAQQDQYQDGKNGLAMLSYKRSEETEEEELWEDTGK